MTSSILHSTTKLLALLLLVRCEWLSAGKLDNEAVMAGIIRNNPDKTNTEIARLLLKYLKSTDPHKEWVTLVYDADNSGDQERVGNGLWDVLGEKYKKALAFSVDSSSADKSRTSKVREVKQKINQYCAIPTETGKTYSQIPNCRRKDLIPRCSHHKPRIVHDELRRTIVPVTMSLAVIRRVPNLAIVSTEGALYAVNTCLGTECKTGFRNGAITETSSGLFIIAVPRVLL